MIAILRYAFMSLVAMTILVMAGPETAAAMDPGGCLTCHKYPGLVRPEMPEGFKVFHIDEERYLRSDHGEVACRECHTVVDQVPHVGATETNCTNGCHKTPKEKKKVADYKLSKLHEGEKSYITRLEDGSSCRVCHRLYPHKSNELARAFINMHIGFMICETCHIKREKFENLVYGWTSSEEADFAGEPFGARFNPNISAGAQSSHFISRIATFEEENGEKRLLLNTWDTPEARIFMEREETLDPEEKKERLAFFHRDMHKEEVSVTCNECHSKEGILDFRALGFSEKKAKELIYLNIKGMVTKYEIFYFPKMLSE
jgi:hypothetical protein